MGAYVRNHCHTITDALRNCLGRYILSRINGRSLRDMYEYVTDIDHIPGGSDKSRNQLMVQMEKGSSVSGAKNR